MFKRAHAHYIFPEAYQESHCEIKNEEFGGIKNIDITLSLKGSNLNEEATNLVSIWGYTINNLTSMTNYETLENEK